MISSEQNNNTKTVFFGTPELAVFALEEMRAVGAMPDLIVTMPDAPAGRGRVLTAPPVKVWARQNNIPTLQPEKLNDKFIKDLQQTLTTDDLLFTVFAYGKILPERILNLPNHGTLNIHPSLLPKLRGPSPIRTAILKDMKDELGVSIILLDEEMDHGPVVVQEKVKVQTWPIMGKDLDELLARRGGKLLARTAPLWISGKVETKEQEDDNATFSKLFKKEDALIDMSGDDYQNYLKICAYDGWPGAYFYENNKRFKITSAHLGGGKLIIDKVIPEGKKETLYRG